MRSIRSSRSSKASRRRPAPGKAKSCRRASRRLRAGLARRSLPRRPRRLGAADAAQCASRTAAKAGQAPVRTTPITLLARRHAPLWAALSPAGGCRPRKSARRARSWTSSASTAPRSSTRSSQGTGLLRSQVEEALAELVALGLVSSDSFAGLRALLVPSAERRPIAGGRRRRRTVKFGMEDAGRWALARRLPSEAIRAAIDGRGCRACRAHAAAPLRRRVLAPARARSRTGCRRGATCCGSIAGSRARGDIRGGRFVAGFSGEQFALPDAIGACCARRGASRRRRTGLGVGRRSAQSRRASSRPARGCRR